MGALLQAVGNAEVQAGWSGLWLALSTVSLGLMTALGAYLTDYLRGKREVNKRDLELKSKELELRQLELDDKIRQLRKAAARDAVAIVEEVARAQPGLKGEVKQELAAEKLRELDPASKQLEGSALNDLVKLGVSELRHSSATTYLVTPSLLPPAERVNLSARPSTRPPEPRTATSAPAAAAAAPRPTTGPGGRPPLKR